MVLKIMSVKGSITDGRTADGKADYYRAAADGGALISQRNGKKNRFN